MKTKYHFLAECQKMRRSGFYLYHVIVMVSFSILISAYYQIRSDMPEMDRMMLVLEIIASVSPIYYAISDTWIIRSEEESHFQNLLCVKDRKRAIMSKMIFTWSICSIGIIFMLALIIVICKMTRETCLIASLCGFGMVVFGIFYHLFHEFIGMKFGTGVGLLIGIIECLQAIILSNVSLYKGFKIIPFAWVSEWVNAINKSINENFNLMEYRYYWLGYILLEIMLILTVLVWFSKWDGRKGSID